MDPCMYITKEGIAMETFQFDNLCVDCRKRACAPYMCSGCGATCCDDCIKSHKLRLHNGAQVLQRLPVSSSEVCLESSRHLNHEFHMKINNTDLDAKSRHADLQTSALKEKTHAIHKINQLTWTIADIDSCISHLLDFKTGLRRKQEVLEGCVSRLSSPHTTMVPSFSKELTEMLEEYSVPSVCALAALKACVYRLKQGAGKEVQYCAKRSIYIDNAEELQIVDELVEVNIGHHSRRDHLTLVSGTLESDINIKRVGTVKVAIRKTTLNFDSGTVLVTALTDPILAEADNNINLVTVEWNSSTQKEGQETERNRCEQESRNKKWKLNLKLKSNEKKWKSRISKLIRQHRTNIHEERVKVVRFILHLEERDRLLSDFLNQLPIRLPGVIKRLLTEFNIRLLGVDCGLNFLLERSGTLWRDAVEQQLVENVLQELLSEYLREGVKWSDLRLYSSPLDIDLRIGQPSPMDSGMDIEVHRDRSISLEASYRTEAEETKNGFVSTGLENFILTKTRNIQINSPNDTRPPCITALVMTQQGQIILADNSNSMVKLTTLVPFTELVSLKLGSVPLCLARLRDDRVVVTASARNLYVVCITGQLRMTKHARTKRQYHGVGVSEENDAIVVSCCDWPCSVDVIKTNGQIIRTVTASKQLEDLCYPRYLCVVGREVIISDCVSNSVFRVDLSSGQVIATIRHPAIQSPYQVSADDNGNVYIASRGNSTVLMLPADGHLRHGVLDEGEGRIGTNSSLSKPYGLYHAKSVLLVSWRKPDATYVVTASEIEWQNGALPAVNPIL